MKVKPHPKMPVPNMYVMSVMEGYSWANSSTNMHLFHNFWYIYFYFISEGWWYHGNALCYFFFGLDVSASTTSILHLCVISADRYMAIVHPMMYPLKMTKRFAMCVIGSVWSIALCLSYPLIYYGYVVEPPVQENTCPLPNSILFNLVSAILTFYLPTTIMLILYRRIFLTARTHSRRLQNGRLELSGGGGHDAMRIHRGGGGRAVNQESRRHTNLKIEYKAARTVGLVIGAFLFCWFPFFVVFAISPWCDTCNMSRDIFSWLGFINSAVNPFIYAFTSSSFKMAFMRILRVRSSRRRRRPPIRESTVAAIHTSSQEKSETMELGSIHIHLQ